MSVSVKTTTSLELGASELLFEILNMVPDTGFDVRPDGERFVVVRSVGSGSETTRINVIVNRLQELTERVARPVASMAHPSGCFHF